jgi:hypothetical protein
VEMVRHFLRAFFRGVTAGFTSDGDPGVPAARWRARAVGYPLLIVGLVVLLVRGPLALGVALVVVGVGLMMYMRYQIGKGRALSRRKGT